MWRFHMVHHSDTEVDATTGTRHHPGDYFIEMTVSGLLGMLFFLFFILTLNWFLRKKAINYMPEEDLGISNYTFNFENATMGIPQVNPSKKVSLASKLVLCALAMAIIFTPLYKFIQTLEPLYTCYWCF